MFQPTLFQPKVTMKSCTEGAKKKKHRNIEKIVYLCSWLCCIHSPKYMFYISTVGHLQNIFMEHNIYLIS